jgi:molybdenum cofactor synthesis domain-containing protein
VNATGSQAGNTAIVYTVSDRCHAGKRQDLSGPAVAARLTQLGFEVVARAVVPDELEQLTESLRSAAARVRLVVTTGGTGIAARDITPEATRAVCEKLIEGIPELMRAAGTVHTPTAALSRALCGSRGDALILNLPGSPEGAVTSLDAVAHLLEHALALLAGETEH